MTQRHRTGPYASAAGDNETRTYNGNVLSTLCIVGHVNLVSNAADYLMEIIIALQLSHPRPVRSVCIPTSSRVIGS